MAKDPSKTEKATPRRREKAREEGQVAKSQDIPISATLMIISLVLLFYIPFAYHYSLEYYRFTFANAHSLIPSLNQQFVSYSLKTLGILILPIFMFLLITGIVSNLAQFGFLFTLKPLTPKLDKINPVSGLKRLVSLKTLFELVRNILKLFVATVIALVILKILFSDVLRLAYIPVYQEAYYMIKYTMILLLAFTLLSIPIAVIDFIYRKFDFEENIKMSKDEIKEERKLYEGNPQIKSAIKKKQRELSMLRMMSEVGKADVVITNPEHFAVALKYEKGKMEAPKVVAKGVDNVAQKIKEVAREHDVPIVEDPPLARSLYKSCEIGDYIPENLYMAIAKILAKIYKRKGIV